MPATAFPDTLPEEDTVTRTQLLQPYSVILHNDDINTMDFVVAVLQKVFSYRIEKCMMLMTEAHETGRSVVWVGPLEVAELKADQIHSCGPDPTQKDRGAEALRVTIEPAE
ncbi:MAG TPA: ATP-dependent Clp protease adaptor ClpS [Fimbriiglobus sp.]|jgi:ATP-dependent Clp protease adaptor protein ClpS